MARSHLYKIFQNADGSVLTGATVAVLDPDTSDPISAALYTTDTGSTTLANPFTSDDGKVEFYLDNPQRLRLGITPAGGVEFFVITDAYARADLVVVSSVPDLSLGTPVVGFVPQINGSGQYEYVDPATFAGASAVVHRVAAVETTGTVFTTSPPNGLSLFDGGSLLLGAGQRVALTNQTNAADNGLWVTSGTDWTRPTDWDTGDTILNGTVIVVGYLNNHHNLDSMWVVEGDVLVGTDDCALDCVASSKVLTVVPDATGIPVGHLGKIHWSGYTTDPAIAGHVYADPTTGLLLLSETGTGIDFQTSDPDLTAIAGLDSSTSGMIASDGGGWIKKTYAQVKAALGISTSDVSGLGSAATHAASDFLLAANNLSDVTAATARTNLGLGTAATHATTDYDASGAAATAQANAYAADAAITANRQTASYTLVLSDAGEVVEMNSASANNCTVPPHSSVAFATGAIVEVVQYGAGQTTLVAGAGVTIRSPGGKLKIADQYGAAALRYIGSDEWIAAGDLTT